MKTVKQIADELGVSKQAVQKRIAREPLYTRLSPHIFYVDRTKYIDENGVNIIKSAYEAGYTKREQSDSSTDVANNRYTKKNNFSDLMSILQAQLEAKDRQLDAKDKQIGELTAALQQTTASLQAAHALHAGTIQNQKKLTGFTLEQDEAEPAKTDELQNSSFIERIKQLFK